MTTYPEEIRQDDGDELGSIMGWHLDGHVDLFEVEMFMDSEEVAETFDGGTSRGFDVEHLYVRKVPAEFGWRYQYSQSPGRGLHPVTRVQHNVWWERWCFNHPQEPAERGISPANVTDAEPLEGDSFIYLCRACTQRFDDRLRAARQAATEGAPMNHADNPIFADGDQEQADRIAELISTTTADRQVDEIVAAHAEGSDED